MLVVCTALLEVLRLWIELRHGWPQSPSRRVVIFIGIVLLVIAVAESSETF